MSKRNEPKSSTKGSRNRVDGRTALLDAACRSIARKGLRGLRVEEVAGDAGVAPSFIYYPSAIVRRCVVPRSSTVGRGPPPTRKPITPQLAADARDWFQVGEIEPGLHLVAEPGHVFNWLIAGSERSVLLDTGFGLADITAATAPVTAGPTMVINSHVHFDHVGGNELFEHTEMHSDPRGGSIKERAWGMGREGFHRRFILGAIWSPRRTTRRR